jgi:hypothetical protein
MSFNILYIEDQINDYEPIRDAINKFNKDKDSNSSEYIVIDWARNLEEFENKLNLKFDVILADVIFPGPKGEKKLLKEIIASVDKWAKENNAGRTLPIIAYSGKGTLKYSLKFKTKLYDIWDKNSTSPEYILWRFSELAKDLPRHHPDSFLQRLIREMPEGASWHSKVIDMATRYNSGWTEADQIYRVGPSIDDIANVNGVRDACKSMWEIMNEWEPLSLAVSMKMRGHARHAINVFWLGYYIINHENTQHWFVSCWERLVNNQPNMNDVSKEKPIDALSNIWFLTGLFHDIGACVEKCQKVYDCYANLLKKFNKLIPQSFSNESEHLVPLDNNIEELVDKLLYAIGSPLNDNIKSIIKKSFKSGEPDHGFIAALNLLKTIQYKKPGCYAREAARAMAVHNVIGKVSNSDGGILSWEKEPISCLLVLCDQIQTWERERGDRKLSDIDKPEPERAELLRLDIEGSRKKPHIIIDIDYIAPRHVFRDQDLYTRTKDKLQGILRDYPEKTLNKIKTPWPFDLTVNPSLSRDKLEPIEIKKSM